MMTHISIFLSDFFDIQLYVYIQEIATCKEFVFILSIESGSGVQEVLSLG